jgi:serine/threonine protein kinase
MILGKYKNKKKLGKGAYGEVLLVEDNKGQQYALKLITMKSLLKESYLVDYLEGEIECMKSLNSPYIMKLLEAEED